MTPLAYVVMVSVGLACGFDSAISESGSAGSDASDGTGAFEGTSASGGQTSQSGSEGGEGVDTSEATTRNQESETSAAGGEASGSPTSGSDSMSTATSAGESTSIGSAGESTSGGAGSPGCGSSPGATGVIEATIDVRGQMRTYLLSIPASYDANEPYPLVFGWHGRGSNAAQARAYFGIEEASAGQAVFVYSDGLPQASVDGDSGWDLTAGGDDVALFDAILVELLATLCIDEKRVFSTGHSFGGYMSNALGCFRGDVLRGIAPVASGGPFGACVGPMAAWITHGTKDERVNISLGEATRDYWADANGCSTTTMTTDPEPCIAYRDCGAGTPVIWCQHEETALMGHGWPSFIAQGAWNFFASL